MNLTKSTNEKEMLKAKRSAKIFSDMIQIQLKADRSKQYSPFKEKPFKEESMSNINEKLFLSKRSAKNKLEDENKDFNITKLIELNKEIIQKTIPLLEQESSI